MREDYSPEHQKSVVAFLKSKSYQEVLEKYNNIYEAKVAQFKEKYKSDEYEAGEMKYSELKLQAERQKILEDKINDIMDCKDYNTELMIVELLQNEIKNLDSQLLNSVTNSFGGSKDIATFTEDDLEKYRMLFNKDFHAFIVGLMNTNKGQEFTMQDKYDIYNDPEDYFNEV